MTIKIKTKGMKELQRKLRDLRRKARDLAETDFVSFDELFPPAFMAKHTNFASVEDMFQASGFTIESQEDFNKIPDDEWDTFIKDNTRFPNWEEMVGTASGELAARKLGFDKL